MAVDQFANGAQTTLNGAINSSVTSITVQPGGDFPAVPQFRIVIDNELLMVTALSGSTWTVTRGLESTTPAAHANGTPVVQVVTAGALNGLIAAAVPVGSVTAFAGVAAPTGWLMCDGSAVSRTTYASLASIIAFVLNGTTTNGSTTVSGLSATTNLYVGMALEGTGVPGGTTVATIVSSTSITLSNAATASGTVPITFYPFGDGDGSTTFNLPDLRGRAPVGPDTGGTHLPVGKPPAAAASGGEETHTLTNSEIPSHSHGPGSGSQFVNYVGTGGANATGAGASQFPVSNTTAAAGGGGAHNNMPPWLALNYIIKT